MISSNRKYQAARRSRRTNRPSREKPKELVDYLRECERFHLDQLWGGNNPADHDQLICAFKDPTGLNPISLPRTLHETGHLLNLGNTGGGKTAMMISQGMQLTQQNRRRITEGRRASSLFLCDLKPDYALHHALRNAATRPDGKTRPIPFNFLNLGDSNAPTMSFNIFEQPFFMKKTDREKTAFLVPAIGMDDGLGYGKRHFTAHSYEALTRMLMIEKPRSFRDLAKYGKMTRKQFAARLRVDPSQYDAMESLLVEIQNLARVPQLNVSKEKSYGVPSTVVNNAIDIEKAFLPGHEQIIHFAINSSLERKTGPILASIFMASVVDVANLRRTKDSNFVSVFADEIQMLADGNNIADWIAKCRGAKVSLYFGTQTLSQWDPKVQNIIVSQTNFKAIFNATDAILEDELIRMSATKKEAQVTYNESVTMGENSQGSTYSSTSGTSTVYKDVPGISVNDVHDLNWNNACGALVLHSNIPGNRYRPRNGCAVPIFRSFPFPKEEHDVLSGTDFQADPGTFIPAHYPELMADPVFSSPQPSSSSNGPRKSRDGNGRKQQDKTQRREAEATEFADVFEEIMSEDFPG